MKKSLAGAKGSHMVVYMAALFIASWRLKMIISPKILILLLIIVLLGYGIVHLIASRKWGYTKKREEELSNRLNDDLPQ